MASSHVMIFAVIGHNTINIPEIFQVFTVSRSHCNCTFSSLEDLGALYFKGCYLLWRIFLRKTSHSLFWVWLGNSSLKLWNSTVKVSGYVTTHSSPKSQFALIEKQVLKIFWTEIKSTIVIYHAIYLQPWANFEMSIHVSWLILQFQMKRIIHVFPKITSLMMLFINWLSYHFKNWNGACLLKWVTKWMLSVLTTVTQLTLYLDQKGFGRWVLFNQPSP